MERQTITGILSTSGRLSGALSVGGGTTDYNELENKPTYNGHVIEGDMTNESLGIWQPFDLIPDTEYDTGIKWNNQTLYCMIIQESISGNYVNKAVTIDGTPTPIFNIWSFRGGNGNYLVDDPDYFKYRQVWGNVNELSIVGYKNNTGAYGSNNEVRVIVFYTKTV